MPASTPHRTPVRANVTHITLARFLQQSPLVMAHRTFSDVRGVAWEVWDVFPRLMSDTVRREAALASISGQLAQGWLAFQAGESRRRLAPVPARWEEASDEQLQRWCSEALAVVPRQRSPSPETSIGR